MDLESSTIYRALQAGASTVNQPQRYINASGKYIHTINTTIPVKDADGKLLAVIEVANDVTQLSELCDRLGPSAKSGGDAGDIQKTEAQTLSLFRSDRA